MMPDTVRRIECGPCTTGGSISENFPYYEVANQDGLYLKQVLPVNSVVYVG